MEITLWALTSCSFLIFWIVLVGFYTPDCFNLCTMMDSIDLDGELIKTRAPLKWYLTNFHTLTCWTISLPKSEKYLKYDIVNKAVKRISKSRRIMVYTGSVFIITGSILLIMVN